MVATPASPPPLVGMGVADLERLMVEHGEKPFHGRQVAKWIYQRLARDMAEMTDLSKPLRAWLGREHPVGAVEVAHVAHARDETHKVLLQLADSQTVEGVLMREDRRWTMCLSSQVGCPLRCQFCVTGTLGLRRNLTAGEMVDQVLVGKRLLRERDPEAQLTNVVFMGMGEPLLNCDHLFAALHLLTSPQCMAMSPRRITVSTSGVIPGIRRLAAEGPGVNLALSLNATRQDLREMLMPHAKQWPLGELLAAVREFPLSRQRRLTIEYVLLAGVNDAPADARRLAKLVRGLPCKINLIPLNEAPPLPFERPTPAAVERFHEILVAEHFTVSVRHSKGRSIGAACGQLAGVLARDAA